MKQNSLFKKDHKTIKNNISKEGIDPDAYNFSPYIKTLRKDKRNI